MKTKWKMGAVLAIWACVTALPVFGQGAAESGSVAHIEVSSRAPASAAARPAGEVVREIDDPSNGDRWLLLRDASHPGGPGRLVLTARRESGQRRPESAGAQPAVVRASVVPVIHAGELLVVEENTAIASARLEAVALAPAEIGAEFAARLRMGGKVVRAVALGPGRAAFAAERTAAAPQIEGRP